MTPQPERLSQYQNLRNIGTDFKATSSQARRRQDALARQKEQRRLAFSLAREGLDDVLDDLTLSDSSTEDAEQDDSSNDRDVSRTKDGRFDDANESLGDQAEPTSQADMRASTAGGATTSSDKTSKSRRPMPKRIRKKGEILDLEGEGLPIDLAGEWLGLGPVPKGKRCMAVTFVSTRTSRRGKLTNTILLARTTGKPILRQHVPILPPNCVLDCIYVRETAALYVLDVLQWKGQSVAEGEAEFRMFWRDSMLAELPMQVLPTWYTRSTKDTAHQAGNEAMQEDRPTSSIDAQNIARPSHLLLVPVPCLAASSDFPQQLLTELVQPCLDNETGEVVVSVRGNAQDIATSCQPVPHRIACEIDGLTLLLKSAAYESGLTPLAAWVPRAQLSQLAQCLSSDS